MPNNLFFFEIGYTQDHPDLFWDSTLFDWSFKFTAPDDNRYFYDIKFCSTKDGDFAGYEDLGLDFEGTIQGHTWALNYSRWVCLGPMRNNDGSKTQRGSSGYVDPFIQSGKASLDIRLTPEKL